MQNEGRSSCGQQLVYSETCSATGVILDRPMDINSRQWVMEDVEGYPEGIKRLRTRTRTACGAPYLGVLRSCTAAPTLRLFSATDSTAALLWAVAPTVDAVCPSFSWTYRAFRRDACCCLHRPLLPLLTMPVPAAAAPCPSRCAPGGLLLLRHAGQQWQELPRAD